IIAFAEKCFSFFNRYQECTSRFEISKKLKIASYLLFQSSQISPCTLEKLKEQFVAFLEVEWESKSYELFQSSQISPCTLEKLKEQFAFVLALFYLRGFLTGTFLKFSNLPLYFGKVERAVCGFFGSRIGEQVI